jgi:hypothetical protein
MPQYSTVLFYCIIDIPKCIYSTVLYWKYIESPYCSFKTIRLIKLKGQCQGDFRLLFFPSKNIPGSLLIHGLKRFRIKIRFRRYIRLRFFQIIVKDNLFCCCFNGEKNRNIGVSTPRCANKLRPMHHSAESLLCAMQHIAQLYQKKFYL